MAISRAQLLKELLPGLNALFGLEYATYGEQHKEIYETETSERSFEEETKLSGFSAAPVKNEGSAIGSQVRPPRHPQIQVIHLLNPWLVFLFPFQSQLIFHQFHIGLHAICFH